MQEVTALILAAGKGTRMKSRLAKVLHPLLGQPLLAYPLDAARQAGVARPVVVVGHHGDDVRAAFSKDDALFVEQKVQRGTADAVASARDALGSFRGTILILCGDVPLLTPQTLEALLAAHRADAKKITVLSMTPADPSGYGRLVRDSQGRLARIVEERDATVEERAVREVNTGTYAVESPWLWEALSKVGSANSQGEFYLTDIVAQAAETDGAGSLILPDETEAMGINSRAQLAEAASFLRRRVNLAWMEAGVTLEDPDTAWIEPGVTLSEDVTLGPGVVLRGDTAVGPGTRIETGCVVEDTTVGTDVHVKPYCILNGARVADGAVLGPFAHLRPKADVRENAHVGNFVELKNTRLGRGSKANHLAYLGDTEIGEGANIGAGTITCNYDGAAKHRTIIGDRAFIGSNASLVAPVIIGDEATVGAGSTITHNIGSGALGLGRSKQRNVEGWNQRSPVAKKKKEG